MEYKPSYGKIVFFNPYLRTYVIQKLEGKFEGHTVEVKCNFDQWNFSFKAEKVENRFEMKGMLNASWMGNVSCQLKV